MLLFWMKDNVVKSGRNVLWCWREKQ